ncbi:hypothetical protein [Flavobacterium wongokense]|uniref:hypothetical protein n=1 Tax=Flavobacterium wongokense TaxID=2910674 RepID=UPI001F188815|nr:hypothetical protein [Flavobacterium sp. WG47]MCF6130830.1 hypothetical protein [Flavobacterium sp. WG47]
MKKLAVLFIIGLCASCTTDSVDDITDVTITGYRIEKTTSPGYNNVTIGNLLNGKLYSETHQETIGGVVQEPTTQQIFFYNTDGTVNRYVQHYPSYDRMVYLYYDADQNLIGAKTTLMGGPEELYYRFVHNLNNTVFFEKINAAYDNPAAMAYSRIVLQFNNNDDVVSAGIDANFDGVAENANTFQYNNNNISRIAFSNGTVVDYEYSNIIDSSLYLWDKSIGGKTRKIIAAECYWAGPSSYFMDNLSISKNILQENASLATFQVLPNNFYQSKTLTLDTSGTTVTQFFFD